MKPCDVFSILSNHDNYWDTQNLNMKSYKSMYNNKYWDDNIRKYPDSTAITINVPTAYNTIESYMASLFPKHPSVELEMGIQDKGDIKKSKKIADKFLLENKKIIEQAALCALIFPCSFLKLIPMPEEQYIFSQVKTVAVNPWDVILDYTASDWSSLKYIGHIYYLTFDEADKRFGAKDWHNSSMNLTTYLDDNSDEDDNSNRTIYDTVRIIEFFSFEDDQLYWLCPEWNKDKFLEKSSIGIPFRDVNNEPYNPIIPLYFNQEVDNPMKGFSTLGRIYDQCKEINIFRTAQANAVRKASRQYIVKKGVYDPEEMNMMMSGTDGMYIEVEADDISSTIIPVPHVPMPAELEQYVRMVSADKDAGSLLSPLTRGEAVRTTATETAALVSYSSTEIGKYAHARDTAISQLAKAYLNMLSIFLSDDKAIRIKLDGEDVIVRKRDVLGDFTVFATNITSEPMNDIARAQTILNNTPALIDLGVPKEFILDELVKAMKLPEKFKASAIKEYMKQNVSQTQNTANIPNISIPGGNQAPSPMQAIMSPSPSTISNILGK